MSTPTLRVALERDRVRLAGGGSASVAATVRNVGRTVQHVEVRVVGLPDRATYGASPEAVKLLPGAEAVVTVEVRLPQPAPVAGTHVLGVLCRSTHDPSVSRCEELVLTVEPEPGLALTFDRQLVRSHGRARFVATVTNTGNTPLAAAVAARDAEGRMRLDLRPPALDLGPGASGDVVLTASTPALWTGQERQHAVRIDVAAPDAAAQAAVTLVQRPRLPAGALRLVGGGAALVALAGAVVAASLLGQDDGRTAGDDASSPPAEVSAAPSPTASGSASASPTPSPTDAPTGTPSPATASPTATATPPASAERVETFDALAPGAVPGDFDGFSVSAHPLPGQTDCPVLGLLAEDRAGDVVVLSPAIALECHPMPLLVRFDDPARDVVLAVPDDGTRYALHVEAWNGGTHDHEIQAVEGRVEVPAAASTGLRSVILSREQDPAAPVAGPVLALSAVTWRGLEG